MDVRLFRSLFLSIQHIHFLIQVISYLGSAHIQISGTLEKTTAMVNAISDTVF